MPEGGQKALAEGQSPPQELEVSPHSGLYLLVTNLKLNIRPQISIPHCFKIQRGGQTERQTYMQTYRLNKPIERLREKEEEKLL